MLELCSACAVASSLACAGRAGAPETARPPAPVTALSPARSEPPPPAEVASPAAAPGDLGTRIALFDRIAFSSPSAIIFDEKRDVYWVSNLDTEGAEPGGFISRLDPEGVISTLNFIDARQPNVKLESPHGLAVSDEFLFVADVHAIRKFRAADGEPSGTIEIPDAEYLSDIAVAADGTLYATDVGGDPAMASVPDTGRDAVFQITASGQVSVVAQRPELGGPQALLANQSGLWITCTGTNQLLLLIPDASGAPVADAGRLDLPLRAPRGIAAMPDGSFLISSAVDGAVYRGLPEGPFQAVVTGLESPADLDYDPRRKRLLIPLLTGHAVAVFEVSPAAPAAPVSASPGPSTGQVSQRELRRPAFAW